MHRLPPAGYSPQGAFCTGAARPSLRRDRGLARLQGTVLPFPITAPR